MARSSNRSKSARRLSALRRSAEARALLRRDAERPRLDWAEVSESLKGWSERHIPMDYSPTETILTRRIRRTEKRNRNPIVHSIYSVSNTQINLNAYFA